MNSRHGVILFWFCLGTFLLTARLIHADFLWPDEDYHLAVAIQVLHGKALYRDIWYDKPPLSALIYAVLGAPTGWPLRIFDGLFATGCCGLAYRFAEQLWSRREGFIAAAMLALVLVFNEPSAVIALAPDTLLLAPHLAAVYLAWKKKPLLAGLVCGIAFLLNTKAVFVLVACAVFGLRGWPLLTAGFLVPNIAAVGWWGWTGALSAYFQQVWRWGLLYAADPSARVTADRGLRLLLKWAGFHLPLVIGAVWFWWRVPDAQRRRLGLWTAISLAAVSLGWRFYPQYFIQLLPPLVIAAARGISCLAALERRRLRSTLAATMAAGMLIAIVRFQPLRTRQDNVMGRDSKEAVRLIENIRQPGDTIFIWGTRPDVSAWTRLPIDSRFWDSQPLTTVPSNRHLRTSQPMDAAWAQENRLELAKSRPSIMVDGLSNYNPELAIHSYPELAEWMQHYCVTGNTGLTAVYRLCDPR